MNYEAVYRTAPATPGLLKIEMFTNKYLKIFLVKVLRNTKYIQAQSKKKHKKCLKDDIFGGEKTQKEHIRK